jgi:hypothetical protein
VGAELSPCVFRGRISKNFKSFIAFLVDGSKVLSDLVEENALTKVREDFCVVNLSELMDDSGTNLATMKALRKLQAHRSLKQRIIASTNIALKEQYILILNSAPEQMVEEESADVRISALKKKSKMNFSKNLGTFVLEHYSILEYTVL